MHFILVPVFQGNQVQVYRLWLSTIYVFSSFL